MTRSFMVIFFTLSAVLAPLPAAAASDRLTIVISDLHLGGEAPPPGKAAHPWEDFRWTEDLRAFVQDITAFGEAKGAPVDLVIAGDFLELWQSSAEDCRPKSWTLGCSEEEAVARVRSVTALHRPDLKALGEFAAAPNHRLVIVPGNHDAALLFPKAAAELVAAIGELAPASAVTVAPAGYYLTEDGMLLVEHGHQDDPANRFATWPAPFQADDDGVTRLARPVGEWFVLDFFEDLESRWPLVDNTTDDVGVAKWLASSVPLQDAMGAAWSILTVGHTYKQRFDFARIGSDKAIPWDIGAARAEGDRLLWRISPVELRPSDPPPDAGIVAGLSDLDLASICEAVPTEQNEQCPQRGGAHATAAARSTSAKARSLGEYLNRRRSELKAPVSAYVFGHTHEALIRVDDAGDAADTVNTGAFQRVVEVQHLRDMAGDAPPADWLEGHDVADLPACYSFVMVRPYGAGGAPNPLLLFWSRQSDGSWKRTTAATAPPGCVTGKS